MALIKCPECGKQVSTNAEVCPHCGNPLKEKEIEAQKSILIESEPGKTYMRDKRHHWIGEIIGCILGIIVGIVFLCISKVTSYGEGSIMGIWIGAGILLIIICTIGIIYYSWRLRHY